jgi:hypothetical protein
VLLTEQYTAGASAVVAVTRVKSHDFSTGTLTTVGGLVIDYTQLLASQRISVSANDLIRVAGTQPQPGGTIVATALQVLKK